MPEEKSTKLLAHELGAIDLSDVEIEEKEQTEVERDAYCSAISAIFPRLEKDIKKFLYAQLLFSSNQSEDWGQVLFGRGSFHGMSTLLEHWRIAHIEHTKKGLPKEEADKTNPMPEI